eukprot:5565454-Prymnesium_polylepis.1
MMHAHTHTHRPGDGYVPACPDGAPRLPARPVVSSHRHVPLVLEAPQGARSRPTPPPGAS